MSAYDKVLDCAVEEFSKRKPNEAFDPAIIFVLFDIINQLLEAFQKCKQTPEQVLGMANDPSLLQKLVLRRTVINTVGRREFRQHGEDLVEALYATGRRVELPDVQELLDG